jgi:predicted GIY-YIG superfamily endonuclease
MKVDGCQYSFRTLATRILPKRMREMRQAIGRCSLPLSYFDTPGFGLKQMMKELEIEEDFSGCYVLIQGREPVYAGISRRVLHRLRAHIRGKSHYQATLAYRMASAETDLDLTRDEQMQDKRFLSRFSRKKQQMKQWRVAWVAIENPVELHLFEVYCAMELKTSKWNTFKTH